MRTNALLSWPALVGGLMLSAGALFAQDSGPLIDLLVKKGIVNDQEAEELRTELVKSFTANTAAGKLNMSSSLAEFKLSGDMRLRHQEETRAVQNAGSISNERTRERYRFRFNGDALLQKGWGAGFALETANAADSGNQTLENGNDDYSVYLARAYVSFRPDANWYFAGGKFKNPFYTTDLLWDSDINPQGFSENYTWNVGGRSGKDTFEVRVAQLLMDDNNEQTFGPGGRDAWLFKQQLVYSTYFGQGNASSLVLAPAYFAYSASTLSGLANETPFNGTTRYLKVITLPGEINFANVAGEGTAFKLYWDFAYNTEADKRVHEKAAYGLASTVEKDATAYLVGIGYAYGAGKMQGDYSLRLDYRELGIGAIDPNLSDSDFGFGNLNQRGFKFAGSYNVTDFASLNLQYFYTYDKRPGLTHAIATLDHSQVLQVDLVVKF